MSSERALAYPSVSVEDMTGFACGTIVHNDKSQVSQGTTQSNSTFVFDSSSQRTTEICRNDAVLAASGDSAHVELGTLVSVDGDKGMKSIINSSPTRTVFSSLQDGLPANLTLDGSIAWDRDESCLYLSANKAFRFRYTESNGVAPSMLVLEGLNPETLQYVPKFEVSSD